MSDVDIDEEHDEDDCDDPYCDEHWTTYNVDLERRVTFKLRVRNDQDADDAANEVSYNIIDVHEPHDETVSDFTDEMDELDVESETDAYRKALEHQERVRQYMAEQEREKAAT